MRHILWLGDGIEGDDTDGHVDDLTRFVDPTTVVTVVEDDPADTNYKPLQENLKRLGTMTDQDGRPSRWSRCRCRAGSNTRGSDFRRAMRTSTSATPWCSCRPTTPRRDGEAIETLQRLFPSRRVVGIDCTDLVWGLGAFHCV